MVLKALFRSASWLALALLLLLGSPLMAPAASNGHRPCDAATDHMKAAGHATPPGLTCAELCALACVGMAHPALAGAPPRIERPRHRVAASLTRDSALIVPRLRPPRQAPA